MDLCSSSSTILKPEDGVQAIPTGVFGPLPPNTFGLIVGRFTLANKGLHIIPTPIEPTFTGELKVLARIFEGALAITSCFPLAQLILLPAFPKLSNPC